MQRSTEVFGIHLQEDVPVDFGACWLPHQHCSSKCSPLSLLPVSLRILGRTHDLLWYVCGDGYDKVGSQEETGGTWYGGNTGWMSEQSSARLETTDNKRSVGLSEHGLPYPISYRVLHDRTCRLICAKGVGFPAQLSQSMGLLLARPARMTLFRATERAATAGYGASITVIALLGV